MALEDDIAPEGESDAAVAEETPKLQLDVKIDERSACERHVSVTIAREEVERYFERAYSEMMPKAQVPGFRAGRVPRRLVEVRFKKEAAEQVKSGLLMDSLTQVTEGGELTPIGEPDFDPTKVVLPDDGPLKFEFDIEVRPEFDLPQWKGLQIDKPVREFTEADVDRSLHDLLARHGRLEPHDGPAEAGDYIVVKLTFLNGEETISSVDEEVIRLRPVLSFRDGRIEDFEKRMLGVRGGETRELTAQLSADAPNALLAGKAVTARFEVHEVKRLHLPALNAAFLEELGGFADEADLRQTLRDVLERQLTFHQQQTARRQILQQLTVTANWDLPPQLLRRQARRELERAVLEMRRSGFSDAEIRVRENELRQNSSRETARALKEHFILERIAEAEKIEAEPGDYDREVELIAEQSGQSVRRVRAQLEKRGLMDSLRNQIVERKVLDVVSEHASFTQVPYVPQTQQAEAVDQAAGGEVDEAAAQAADADADSAG